MFIGSVRVSKDGNTVHLTSINPRSRAVCFPVSLSHRERNCADTIGTVPVPWAGHFQCQNINIFLKWNMRKRFYQTALGNGYGLKLPKCWLLFTRKKLLCVFIIIFGCTLSFPVIVHFGGMQWRRRAIVELIGEVSVGGGLGGLAPPPNPWSSTNILPQYCLNCTKFGKMILRKIVKIVATRCRILKIKCTKFDFGAGELTVLPKTPSGI